MRNHLRRYAMGAMAVGAIAGGTALALPGAAPNWHPVTYGLTETPAQLLPANVSAADPVRVVSSTLDATGRPVVTVHTATTSADAVALVKQGQQAHNALGVEVDAPVSALDMGTTIDKYRTQQWDLGKLKVGEAWQKSTGAGVTVAVIDTGVDASHPDLAGQVLPGFDETTQTAGTSIDPNGHGTHVSGTIAALTGNGDGVASVAPNAKILPIRVLDANGSGYMSDTANGIIYAADHGANVINMSLGATSQVAAVSNAISYARSKGVVVVAAAGNSRASGSPTSYPGADAGVIAVAATDSTDTVAYYSNAGSYVDVAAPGSSILSTYPTAKGNSYAILSGTSMASPHVAAVAALLKSYSSTLTPDQVEQALESSATDLGTPGRDNDYGYGRIDALAALNAVKSSGGSTPPSASVPASTAPSTPPNSTIPSKGPGDNPSTSPSKGPGDSPSKPPTSTMPSTSPSVSPSMTPSKGPGDNPSASPTKAPTTSPSPIVTPSKGPGDNPSKGPGDNPSKAPSSSPSSASPTPTKTKVRPTVTVSSAAKPVPYGTVSTTTFTVAAAGLPWAQRPVTLCLTDSAAGKPGCTSMLTSTAGTVSLQRTATSGFQLQLTVDGTDVSEPAVSPVAVTQVSSKLTVSRTGNTMAVALDGAAGQTVQLQGLRNGTWVTVFTYPAAPRVTITGLTTGQFYRIFVPDTTAILGATSDKF